MNDEIKTCSTWCYVDPENLIERYEIYEAELEKKINDGWYLDNAEIQALTASGLLPEGVAVARHKLGLPCTMKPGTPLMKKRKMAKP